MYCGRAKKLTFIAQNVLAAFGSAILLIEIQVGADAKDATTVAWAEMPLFQSTFQQALDLVCYGEFVGE